MRQISSFGSVISMVIMFGAGLAVWLPLMQSSGNPILQNVATPILAQAMAFPGGALLTICVDLLKENVGITLILSLGFVWATCAFLFYTATSKK